MRAWGGCQAPYTFQELPGILTVSSVNCLGTLISLMKAALPHAGTKQMCGCALKTSQREHWQTKDVPFGPVMYRQCSQCGKENPK